MSQQNNSTKGESSDARMDRIEATVDKLVTAVAGLTTAIATQQQQPAVAAVPQRLTNGRSMAEMTALRDSKLERAFAVDRQLRSELPVGKQQFNVALVDERRKSPANPAGEPLIGPVLVGGENEFQAAMKFQSYYGIRGTSSPSKVECVPVPVGVN